jgi:hypothetical protein
VCEFCGSDHEIVHSFLTGIPGATIETSFIQRSPGVDAHRTSPVAGLATPSSDNGNPEAEINGDDNEIVIGKRPRRQKGD